MAALKAGAFDYVSKPVGLEQLRTLVKSALSLPGREQAVAGRPAAARRKRADAARCATLIAKLARTQAPVYITGESGSGKELAARLIHLRRRAPRPAVRAGQLRRDPREPDGERVLRLPQGRVHRRAGRTATASSRRPTAARCSSTRWPSCRCAMQVKLLRAIQEKRVRKVGATAGGAGRRAHHQRHAPEPRGAASRAGSFRQDLFYRLNVIELKMPPLRECREDIAAIAGGDPRAPGARRPARRRARLSAAALQELRAYDFPGNVRELENILERALALSGGERDHARATCACGRAGEAARRAAGAPRAGRGAAAAGVPRPGRARGDPRRAGEDRLQPHRGGEAARASPSARCATACSGSASANRQDGRTAELTARLDRGRAAGTVAELRQPAGRQRDLACSCCIPSACRAGEYGGDAHRAPVHQPARPGARTRRSPISPGCACRRIS